MLENCCIVSNLLKMKKPENFAFPNESTVTVVESTKKRRMLTSELPLKKRHQSTSRINNGSEYNAQNCKKEIFPISTESPIDFSLPNRIRATNTNIESVKIDNDEEPRLVIAENLLQFSRRTLLNLSLSESSTVNNNNDNNNNNNLDAQIVSSKIMDNIYYNKKPIDLRPLPVEPYIDANANKKQLKNVTIERRIEANARERIRVHTIGAAFDQVRRLLPSASRDHKISKLSILRLACNYIMLLAAMNGLDYSADMRRYSVEECVEIFNETLTTEGKNRRS